jgi:hypothetical protein
LNEITPVSVEKNPTETGKHSVAFVNPVALEKVPAGQRIGELDPWGQKLPAGQIFPVTPSSGVGDDAPMTQK